MTWDNKMLSMYMPHIVLYVFLMFSWSYGEGFISHCSLHNQWIRQLLFFFLPSFYNNFHIAPLYKCMNSPNINVLTIFLNFCFRRQRLTKISLLLLSTCRLVPVLHLRSRPPMTLSCRMSPGVGWVHIYMCTKHWTDTQSTHYFNEVLISYYAIVIICWADSVGTRFDWLTRPWDETGFLTYEYILLWSEHIIQDCLVQD